MCLRTGTLLEELAAPGLFRPAALSMPAYNRHGKLAMNGMVHRVGDSRRTVVTATSDDDAITTEVQHCSFLGKLSVPRLGSNSRRLQVWGLPGSGSG
jgi:hypothetical protein